ncbi:hypothetical protein, partial [Phocaeicola vulgatus]|uniref:hypothetical protein n=1 Tax=Phocaeicola vulgatus TaxID=821 RepID=UPI001C710D13
NVTAEKGFDGAVRHYLRDRGGRVVRETLPSGTEREYGYDACSRTADGNTILRTYDHTGRILTLDSTAGASLRYTRNGYGELEG